MLYGLSVKQGVSLHKLTPQVSLGIFVVWTWFRALSEPMTITSVSDGRHGHKSLHHHGRAFDVRLPPDGVADQLWDCIVSGLGNEWDCVREEYHWHFEWDPKEKS